MEPFELNGIWWLPDNSENKISGKLKYDPKEGAYLELIGTFKTDLRGINSNAFSSPTVILGVTVNGKYVTLYKCFEKSFHLTFPGFPKSVFFVNIIFIGCYFNKEEEILFDEISINFSNLDDWISISGFKQKIESDQSDKIKKVTYTYELPREISAKIDNYDIKISFSFDCHSNRAISFNLSQTIFINIKPSNALGFMSYLDGIIKNVRDFLSLAIGKATHFNTIIGKSRASITKLPNGETALNEIQIYTRSAKFADYSINVDPHDMLFTYHDIADNFGSYLKSWIDRSVLLSPVYGLFFGTFYNPSMYLDHEFLSFAQALESYHRRVLGGKYVSDDAFKPQYEAFIDVIDSKTDPDFRNSLKNKLRYLNEYSLKTRLKEIVEKYGDCISIFIKPTDAFNKDVCNTRNYLTHYDESLNSKAKSGHDLYWLVQKMKIVLEICLLSEIGMPVESIRGLLERKKKYGHRISE